MKEIKREGCEQLKKIDYNFKTDQLEYFSLDLKERVDSRRKLKNSIDKKTE